MSSADHSKSLEFIARRKSTGVYLDIGSGPGDHAAYFLKECPSSLVVSIDGDSSIREILPDNLRKGNSHKKTAWFLPSFISSHQNLYANRSTDDHAGSPFLSEVKIAENSEPVRALALDDVALAWPVGFIRVNAENHEIEVLTSARQTLARHRPELCIEVSPDGLPTLTQMLRGWGYLPVRELADSNWYFIPAGPLASKIDAILGKLPRARRSTRSLLYRFLLLWSGFFRRRRDDGKLPSPPRMIVPL